MFIVQHSHFHIECNCELRVDRTLNIEHEHSHCLLHSISYANVWLEKGKKKKIIWIRFSFSIRKWWQKMTKVNSKQSKCTWSVKLFSFFFFLNFASKEIVLFIYSEIKCNFYSYGILSAERRKKIWIISILY